jgi:hypothetical protein
MGVAGVPLWWGVPPLYTLFDKINEKLEFSERLVQFDNFSKSQWNIPRMSEKSDSPTLSERFGGTKNGFERESVGQTLPTNPTA